MVDIIYILLNDIMTIVCQQFFKSLIFIFILYSLL